MELEYEVEKILDIKMIHYNIYLFIKWKNYSNNENSWEPHYNLNPKSAYKLIIEFKNNYKRKNKKKIKILNKLEIIILKINKKFIENNKIITKKSDIIINTVKSNNIKIISNIKKSIDKFTQTDKIKIPNLQDYKNNLIYEKINLLTNEQQKIISYSFNEDLEDIKKYQLKKILYNKITNSLKLLNNYKKIKKNYK